MFRCCSTQSLVKTTILGLRRKKNISFWPWLFKSSSVWLQQPPPLFDCLLVLLVGRFFGPFSLCKPSFTLATTTCQNKERWHEQTGKTTIKDRQVVHSQFQPLRRRRPDKPSSQPSSQPAEALHVLPHSWEIYDQRTSWTTRPPQTPRKSPAEADLRIGKGPLTTSPHSQSQERGEHLPKLVAYQCKAGWSSLSR